MLGVEDRLVERVDGQIGVMMSMLKMQWIEFVQHALPKMTVCCEMRSKNSDN